MIEDFGAPFLVAVNDHLSIRSSAELIAAAFKFGAQLFEIVDLAIQNDPNRFLDIGHRLVSARQINDGKPPEAQSEWAGDEVALVVGTAVNHRSRHAPDRFRFYRLVSNKVKLAANAAHVLLNLIAEDRRPRTEG